MRQFKESTLKVKKFWAQKSSVTNQKKVSSTLFFTKQHLIDAFDFKFIVIKYNWQQLFSRVDFILSPNQIMNSLSQELEIIKFVD